MKNLIFLLLFVSLIMCQEACQKGEDNDQDDKCGKDIHEVCCIAYDSDYQQTKNDYMNHCKACMSGKCDFTVPRRCCDYPEKAVFCSPSQRGVKICPLIYLPVCAYYGDQDCKKKPCEEQVSNGCDACKDASVLYYVVGRCNA